MNYREYLEGLYEKQMIEDVKLFLNNVRNRGVINMYGATPYIIARFNVPQADATKLLMLWMEEFGK
jgi:hypothetical protein